MNQQNSLTQIEECAATHTSHGDHDLAAFALAECNLAIYRRKVRGGKDTLTPAEAAYGVLAWLTSRLEPVTLSANHDAAVAAELAQEWCDANGLEEPGYAFGSRAFHPQTDRERFRDFTLD